MRACVELAKLWRTDKYLRRLDAIMLVADKDVSLTVTGAVAHVTPRFLASMIIMMMMSPRVAGMCGSCCVSCPCLCHAPAVRFNP